MSSAVLSNAAVPTCIYRSNLPPPTAAELATRKKLGPHAGGQRAICISLSGSDASHSVAEWACQSFLRPTDKVILLHWRGLGEREGVDACAGQHTILLARDVL